MSHLPLLVLFCGHCSPIGLNLVVAASAL